MIVNGDTISALFTNFRTLWEDAFLAASSVNPYDRYTTEVPSTTSSESYNWLGTVPKMSEWIDARKLSGLSAYTYSITNKHYEVSIEVDRDTIEDDKFNLIRPRIAQLAQEAARFPTELAITTLVAGGSNACYDGANFFSTTHSEEATGNQINTNTGTGTTLAQIRADFITARTRMRKLVDGRGRVMNLKPDLVIIPPDLQDVFEQLINTNLIANNSVAMSNNLAGAADILVESLLSDVNDWFMMCTTQPVKALMFQNRKAPEFVGVDNPSDSEVFNMRQFKYGVDARFNVGYGYWQMCQRVTN